MELVETLKALCATIGATPRDSWSLGTGQAHYELLESYWNDFQRNHVALWDADPLHYNRPVIYAEVEGSYTTAKGQLYDIQQRLHSVDRHPATVALSQGAPLSTQSYQRLPQINVPEFSDRREDWEGFRDLFTTLIHQNHHLTDVERLFYLKTLVKGEAKAALESLQVRGSNYETAWALLESRYDNHRLVVHDHLVALRALKPLPDASVRSLQGLIDTLSRHRDQLRSLDCPIDSWDDWFVSIAASCMDLSTRQAWEAELKRLDAMELSDTEVPPGRRLPSFADLNVFLNGRCRMAVACSSTSASGVRLSGQAGGDRPARSFVTRQVAASCPQCNGDHYVGHCSSFTSLEPKERKSVVLRLHLCFNCLRPGHSARVCPSKSTCQLCNATHHTLLHEGGAKHSASANDSDPPAKTPRLTLVTWGVNSTPDPSSRSVNNVSALPLLLPTALVRISGPHRHTIMVRCLLDNCSEVSLIAHSLASKLQAPVQEVTMDITVIGGDVAQRSQHRVSLNLHLPGQRMPIIIEASCLRHLGITTPSQQLPHEAVPASMHGSLADPNFYQPGAVDLLLGANVMPYLMREGLQHINGLVAQRTLVGWIVWGGLRQSQPTDSSHCLTLAAEDIEPTWQQQLASLLQRFWATEELPRAERSSPIDNWTESLFA
uniref:CCHC-type domain-containing protein n=1 Tax=Trichogramma kaykai TaxID=54128 RepID=A0ABD2WZ54_9HYME